MRAVTRPSCAAVPDSPVPEPPIKDPRYKAAQGLLDNSVTCGQLDLDFGAAPNLFRDRQGRLLVGELQKSGVYHVVDTTTMQRRWIATVGASCQLCNGSSTAYDGARRAVFAAVSPGSLLARVSGDDGHVQWYFPLADIAHYEAVTEAAGVVYTIDNAGSLDAVDADTGLPLQHRSLVADVGTDTWGLSSAGISVARHRVIGAVGSHVFAYAAG
jgi:outer membrane protein assembly factor BamB